MNVALLVVVLLVGTVFGTAATVLLRGRRGLLVINVAHGVVGALLGVFLPFAFGRTMLLDSGADVLLRAIFGAFLLVIVANLFRPTRIVSR